MPLESYPLEQHKTVVGVQTIVSPTTFGILMVKKLKNVLFTIIKYRVIKSK